jgi:hypothetical protein
MHRLGWDLNFTTSQPDRIVGGEYIIPPKDCFDWVASRGCAAATPLGARVAALPEDKRAMFERAAGKLWDPKSSEDHGDGLNHSQSMLLEDLYALTGSGQLPTQTKFPDKLVPSVSRTGVSLEVRYSL